MKHGRFLRNLTIFVVVIVVLPWAAFIWYMDRDVARIRRADPQSKGSVIDY
jgi:hypothetical protein